MVTEQDIIQVGFSKDEKNKEKHFDCFNYGYYFLYLSFETGDVIIIHQVLVDYRQVIFMGKPENLDDLKVLVRILGIV